MAEKDLSFQVYQLEVGDLVYFFDGKVFNNVRVEEILITQEKVRMYNVKYVEKNNTFIANGILVHNRYQNKN